MPLVREKVTAAIVFLIVFATALLAAHAMTEPGIRALAILGGLVASIGCATFAALAAHLARGPAGYEPLPGAAGAWGFAEFEDGRI